MGRSPSGIGVGDRSPVEGAPFSSNIPIPTTLHCDRLPKTHLILLNSAPEFFGILVVIHRRLTVDFRATSDALAFHPLSVTLQH